VFNCIKTLVPHEAKLELYQVHAVTHGTDAQAEVSVRLSQDGRAMTSRAATASQIRTAPRGAVRFVIL
jgi:2-isopropylmalate synthase